MYIKRHYITKKQKIGFDVNLIFIILASNQFLKKLINQQIT